jgi:hypothetical protein
MKIAFGGFILFLGLVILSLTILIFTEMIDVTNYIQNHDLLIWIVVIIGTLDIVTGVILFLSK